MDGPPTQADSVAERRERARRVDREGVQIMVTRCGRGVLVAAGDVKNAAPLPRFLDFLGQDRWLAEPGERLPVGRDSVAQQSRADVGVNIGARADTLLRSERAEATEGQRAGRAGQPRVETTSLQ